METSSFSYRKVIEATSTIPRMPDSLPTNLSSYFGGFVFDCESLSHPRLPVPISRPMDIFLFDVVIRIATERGEMCLV